MRASIRRFILPRIAETRVSASDFPKSLKSRFIVGGPVSRELPIRTDLRGEYEKCWELAISTIPDHKFEIATMYKDSGYARTTWNEGLVVLNGDWNYKVQFSIKLVTTDSKPPAVDKIRVNIVGEAAHVKKGKSDAHFLGYDQVLLQYLFHDLQAKLGTR